MSVTNYTVGVDVGGTKTAYGLFNNNAELISQRLHSSDASLRLRAFLT